MELQLLLTLELMNGFPVGDLNWYPELKTLWEAGGTVDVEEISNVIPKDIHLNKIIQIHLIQLLIFYLIFLKVDLSL